MSDNLQWLNYENIERQACEKVEIINTQVYNITLYIGRQDSKYAIGYDVHLGVEGVTDVVKRIKETNAKWGMYERRNIAIEKALKELLHAFIYQALKHPKSTLDMSPVIRYIQLKLSNIGVKQTELF